jgi:hypothetical protein
MKSHSDRFLIASCTDKARFEFRAIPVQAKAADVGRHASADLQEWKRRLR